MWLNLQKPFPFNGHPSNFKQVKLPLFHKINRWNFILCWIVHSSTPRVNKFLWRAQFHIINTLTGIARSAPNGMGQESSSLSPYVQDLARFEPAQAAHFITSGSLHKSEERIEFVVWNKLQENTYTKKEASFFVVVTWQIAKHASYSSIVGSGTNQPQGDDSSL